MTNYQVTIGYQAVFTVNVKADTEQKAKEISEQIFNQQLAKATKSGKIVLECDCINKSGILNMDTSWNLI